MDRAPRLQKPLFRAVVLAAVLAGMYVYSIFWGGGIAANLAGIVVDALLLLAFFQISLFFLAQFTLPVRPLRDRFEVRSRVSLHARRAHGPAVFVRNGRVIQRPGESRRQGPGVAWLDSASAVTTRSDIGFKRVLGPGVHLTASDERIDGAFSLHQQIYSAGPGPDEPVFDRPGEGASEPDRIAAEELHARRTAVSGRTRDGHEVVPRLRVVFRLDARPTQPGRPGSRFGFNGAAVARAAQGEGLNAAPNGQEPQRVAWNQLPGLMAVDLWREYLGKFKLDELFEPTFAGLPEILQPEVPAPTSAAPAEPLIVRRNFPARTLRRINNKIESWLEARGITAAEQPSEESAPRHTPGRTHAASESLSALQIITKMINARLTQAVVPLLDECGRVQRDHVRSEEYKRIRERGIVLDRVEIEGVRFDPAVEAQIVQQWNTEWLANAASDRRRVEQLEMLAEQEGRQNALLEHAATLSLAIRQADPRTASAAAKTLIEASQNEILSDERIYARAGSELAGLSQLLKWLETGDQD